MFSFERFDGSFTETPIITDDSNLTGIELA
jgi:hypothetical protein